MGQYFSNQELVSNIKSFDTVILGHHYKFYTDNGVFSKHGFDFGSRVLVENIPVTKLRGDVLEVGCGYGPIGISLSKQFGFVVDMVDINRRALHLARMNAKENNVNVRIFESDGYKNVDKCYDVIITNPPIRAGKKVVYDILFGADVHLKQNGVLFLVVRKEQGAKSLISDLSNCYNVTIIDKIKGYFVVQCEKRS